MVKRVAGLFLVVSLAGGLVYGAAARAANSAAPSSSARRAELIKTIRDLLAALNQLVWLKQQESAAGPVSSDAVTAPSTVTNQSPNFAAPTLSSPVIDSVNPTAGGPGTVVTIKGRGFTSSGNIIFTGYGQVSRVSSDGATLTFTFDPPGFPTDLGSLRAAGFPDLPFGFYVRNAGGTTTVPAIFILRL